MNFIIDFFANNFENCVWLAVLLIAICPTLESKIAIPLAMNSAIWGANVLSPFWAWLLSFVGSVLPCYIIMICLRFLKKKTTGFVSSRFFQKYTIRGTTIEGQGSDFKKYFALAGLVALPLPLTGVWTGSLIAGLTNLNLNKSFCAICMGGAISAGAITLLCTLFTNSISYIFMISLVIIILFMFVELFISLFKNKHHKIS